MTDGEAGYDCEKAGAELDAFVRGELPLEAAGRMQAHLVRCGHCAQVARYEQAFRDRLRRLGGGCCPEALKTQIAELLGASGPDATS